MVCTMAEAQERDPAVEKWARRGRRGRRGLVLSLVPVVVAIALVWLRLTTIDTIVVLGDSMAPTLRDQDRLLSHRRAYRSHPPERGDVVVVDIPARGTEIKRVIGTPGDIVVCAFGKLVVNGRVVPEPYVPEPMVTPTGPWLVQPGSVFVLGDNRNASEDSRDFGPIEVAFIRSKALFVILPLDHWGAVDDAGEIASLPPAPAGPPPGIAIDTSTDY